MISHSDSVLVIIDLETQLVTNPQRRQLRLRVSLGMLLLLGRRGRRVEKLQVITNPRRRTADITLAVLTVTIFAPALVAVAHPVPPLRLRHAELLRPPELPRGKVVRRRGSQVRRRRGSGGPDLGMDDGSGLLLL